MRGPGPASSRRSVACPPHPPPPAAHPASALALARNSPGRPCDGIASSGQPLDDATFPRSSDITWPRGADRLAVHPCHGDEGDSPTSAALRDQVTQKKMGKRERVRKKPHPPPTSGIRDPSASFPLIRPRRRPPLSFYFFVHERTSSSTNHTLGSWQGPLTSRRPTSLQVSPPGHTQPTELVCLSLGLSAAAGWASEAGKGWDG